MENIFTTPKSEKLSVKQSDRAFKIVCDFLDHTKDDGPCPLYVSSIWFKKICAMAEYIAILEEKDINNV